MMLSSNLLVTTPSDTYTIPTKCQTQYCTRYKTGPRALYSCLLKLYTVITVYLSWQTYQTIFNRPGVARAVLQSPPSVTD